MGAVSVVVIGVRIVVDEVPPVNERRGGEVRRLLEEAGIAGWRVAFDTIAPTMAADLLPTELRPSVVTLPAVPAAASLRSLADARADFERQYLEQVIRRAEGNTAEAARIAGVDRSNFRRLLKRHGLVAANAKP